MQSFPELIITTNLSNATALYTAASQGHANVVDLILEADVNVARIVRNNGKTALHIAARMDHLEVVKLLLMKDPAIGLVTDRKGQTALHVAVKGQSVRIAQELLKNAPYIINLADSKGNTPLHTATRKGRLQVSNNICICSLSCWSNCFSFDFDVSNSFIFGTLLFLCMHDFPVVLFLLWLRM